MHGARNGEEHAFGDEVDELLAALPNGHRIIAYSQPGRGDVPAPRFDMTGRITIETIRPRGSPRTRTTTSAARRVHARRYRAGLTARGVAPGADLHGDVRRRRGDRPGRRRATRAGAPSTRRAPRAGPTVTFSRSNLAVAWDPSYASLLEFAEACDVPVSFGCRTGVCHNCESGLLAGEVTYNIDPLEPPADGRVLVCCTEPAGEMTLEL